MSQKSELEAFLNCTSGSWDAQRTLQLLKFVYIDLQKKSQIFIEFSNDSLEIRLQEVINDETSDRLVLEMACKVYFLLLVKKYNQIDLKEVLNMKSPRASNYILRGVLATNYDFVNHDLLFSIIMTAVETSLVQNSIYTTIALNNLRIFCNTYRNFPFDYEELWRIVALHLSSRFIGAREEALSILEFVVKFNPKLGLQIAEMVLQKWPWSFANKFYVLRTIIEGCHAARSCSEILEMEEKDVIDGLLNALKYRILFSPGQLLFRSLVRRDEWSIVTSFLIQLIRQGDVQQLHNFHVQWSKEIFQQRVELFKILQEENVVSGLKNNDCKIILLDIFKDQMMGYYQEIRDGISMENSRSPIHKQHHYDILLYRIAEEMDLEEDLKSMIDFLGELRENDETSLRQHVLASFVHFVINLISLYSTSGENETEKRQLIESFFIEMIEIVLIRGFECTDPEYSHVILAIRLYEVLMKILYSKEQLIKGFTLEESLKFQSILQEKKVFNGVSEDYFKRLINLLPSNYDDIRQMAVNNLLKYFPATESRRTYIQEVFCERMYFSSFSDSCRIHGYFKVLVPYYPALNLSVSGLFKEYRTLLVDHYRTSYSVDPLRSVSSGIHVFDKINIMREIVLAKGSATTEDLLELMTLLMEISQQMLQFLSLSQLEDCQDDITPSFQVIEESLQVLINNAGRSEKDPWKCHLDRNLMNEEENLRKRKDLLLSIWMTFKACGDLSATIIEVADVSKSPELFSLALEINTQILQRCRHKGAIESTGLSFGRIVAHVSSSRHGQAEYQQLDACLKLLFESIESASYSRRGAGFSILVLNLIRNDRQPNRPLLRKCLEGIFKRLREDSPSVSSVHGTFIHYLSVLVKDSSITQDILPHLNDIVSLCLEKIESPEWNVRNAALQLFGSLVPKLVGQRQHSAGGDWEPCQSTIDELQAVMPKVFNFIEFCLGNDQKISPNLLIAVLSFLTSIENRPINLIRGDDYHSGSLIHGHLFRLLGHRNEKIRSLAATGLARLHAHRRHTDLALKLISTVFTIRDPNLQHGILLVLLYLCQKARLECASEWTMSDEQIINRALLTELKRVGAATADVNSATSASTGVCDYNRLYLWRLVETLGLYRQYKDSEPQLISLEQFAGKRLMLD